MNEKDTSCLQEELRKSDSLEQFVEENDTELHAKSVAEYLNEAGYYKTVRDGRRLPISDF